MTSTPAIDVSGLTHHYARRRALDDLTLSIDQHEVFAFLGPNGGGKTTLFRLLSTLIPIQQGQVSVLGLDARRQVHSVRERIGVVFQAPSLDKKLKVRENLKHQGHLYGLAGAELSGRIDETLARLGLADRAGELVESLSGGLRRRVELAKGMLHHPELLLMDEPSTGLDPAARNDLWTYLQSVVQEHHTTVVMTTHLLDEADKADRIAIVDRGRLAALDTPERLRSTIGGDSITIETQRPDALARRIGDRFDISAAVVDGTVRLEQRDGRLWIARLVEAFPGEIRSITLGKPTLEDVFIARCGRSFRTNGDGPASRNGS